MRHDEGAALVWSDIDDTAPELARITLARQVSGSLKEDRYNQGLTRTIPLHPTLAAVLKAWRHEGWPTYFGRFPGPDDLVVPSPSGPGHHQPKRSSLKQLKRDCDTLAIKRRTFHELRNSFLTLCCEDSPHLEAIIKLMTHTPKGDASDNYIASRWAAKCQAIQAFDIRLSRRGELVKLARPATLAAGLDAGRDDFTSAKMAERTGLEPGGWDESRAIPGDRGVARARRMPLDYRGFGGPFRRS